MKLRKFNDDIYDSFGEAAKEVFDETRQHSKLANEIHENFAKVRAEIGTWSGLSDTAYISQRNRVLGL